MHLQKLILTLVKQGQNFDLFDKTKKSINLKLIKKMSTSNSILSKKHV